MVKLCVWGLLGIKLQAELPGHVMKATSLAPLLPWAAGFHPQEEGAWAGPVSASNGPVSLFPTACHILECCDGLAQEVIGSIGQAFELRFKQYLKCPSKIAALHDR